MRKSWLLSWAQGIVEWGTAQKEDWGGYWNNCFMGIKGHPNVWTWKRIGWMGRFSWTKTEPVQSRELVTHRPWRVPPAWEPLLWLGVASPDALGRKLPTLSTKEVHSKPLLGPLSADLKHAFESPDPESPDSETSNISSSFCLWHQTPWAPCLWWAHDLGLETLGLMFLCSVTLDKLPHLSESQFPQL